MPVQSEEVGRLPRTETGVFYQEEGSGPPLLLLHGVTLSGDMWKAQMAALSGRFRCLAVDRRGHGRSAPMEDGFDPVADLLAVLEHAGVGRCLVLGFSLGGFDAIALAGRYPDRVAALVLAGAWLPVPEMTWAPPFRVARDAGMEAGRAAWLADPLFDPARRNPAVAEALAAMVAGNDLSIWTRRVRGPEPAPPGAAEVAPLITAPTLVLVGELELAPFHALARWLLARIPGAADCPVTVVPDAGHMAPMERPAAFNACVVGFLEQHGASTTR